MLPLDILTGLTSIIVHWPGPVQLPASHWPKLMYGYLQQTSVKSVNNHPNLGLPLTVHPLSQILRVILRNFLDFKKEKQKKYLRDSPKVSTYEMEIQDTFYVFPIR